jgi:hypothetical protein
MPAITDKLMMYEISGLEQIRFNLTRFWRLAHPPGHR